MSYCDIGLNYICVKMDVVKFSVQFFLLYFNGKAFGIQTYYLDEKCDGTISIIGSEQIRLKATRFGDYDSKEDCKVTISASILDKMMIYFKDLSMEDSTSCSNDNLTIYDGQFSFYNTPSKIATLCGFSTPSEIYESSDDYMTIRLRSDSTEQSTGFDAIITQFHEGYCYSYETACSNGKCVDDTIACNGYNSCGDDSGCKARNIAIIVGSTVGGVVFIIAVVAIGVCLYCIRRRNVGRTGYVATGQPVSTTFSSANVTTSNLGTQYNPTSGYNPNAYGVPQVGQQYSTPITYQQPPATTY